MEPMLSFSLLVALTIGIVEVAKRAGAPRNLLPLTALVVGILLTWIGSASTITSLGVLTGIAVGLGASGLFDQRLLFRVFKKEPVSSVDTT